ncbi:MAG: serine/threonine protein kinase [Planctomycetes bacterium]|nr:serine/threonine protein kinase [Planctomycetota bacterium]
MTDIGNYTILEELSKNNLGITYKAYDKDVQKDITLKTFNMEGLGSNLKRFENEVQTLYRLCHPGIISLLGHGKIDNLYCICMEYLPGLNLREIFTYYSSATKTCPSRRHDTSKIIATPFGFLRSELYIAKTICIIKNLCLAVDYANRQGIIHKDLKPENFIVELPEKLISEKDPEFSARYEKPFPNRFLNYIVSQPEITAKITDFALTSQLGTGKFFDDTVPIFGTPEYMSPEQALGESKLDTRTDIFALGVVLYELLTGHSPFASSNIEETLDKVINCDPVAPSKRNYKLAPQLDAVIMKALEKEKEARYQTAKEFADGLGEVYGAMSL